MSSSPSGRELTIAVAGEADWTTADLLQEQLVAALGPGLERLVLDLGGLGFCNLRGLAALHEAVDVAQRAGVDVTMRGMSRQLTWLHSSLTELLPARGRSDLAWSGSPRGSLVVETTAPEHPWQSADTA